MKKKLILFITLLVASALFVPNALAAEKAPELVIFGGKTILLANGNEITIEATEETGYTAVAKYEGGQILLPAGTTIFGGMHNSTEKVDTSITIKGGTVKNVFGGGLHISSVGTANIVVEGGTITGSIMGGSLSILRASLVAQLVRNLPAVQETPVRFLGREDPLEKG